MAFPTNNISQLYVAMSFGYFRARLSTLCSALNTRINIFSKCKPVKYDYAGEDIRVEHPNWYKGKYNNCGIIINGYNSPSEASKDNWSWDAPTGTESEPFRLGDFRGYAPEAIPFFRLNAPDSITADLSKANTQIFYAINASVDSSKNLTWNDFDSSHLPLKDCYLGCYIEKNGSPGVSTFVTGIHPISDSTNDVELDLSGYISGSRFSTGTYDIYFCLCDTIISQDANTFGPRYWPLYHAPDAVWPIKLTIIESLQLPFSIQVSQIAASNTLQSAEFVDIDTVSQPNNGTLSIRSRDVFLKATLTNEEDTGSVTMYKEDIVLNILDHSTGEDYVVRSEAQTNRPWIYLMNESGVIVNTLTIPARSSINAYVVVRDLMYGPSGQLHDIGDTWQMMVEFATVPSNSQDSFWVWMYKDLNLKME